MEDTAVTGALIATVIALTKVVEWLISKYKESKGTLHRCGLSLDQDRRLTDVHENFIILKGDIRRMKEDNDKITDAMVSIADALKKVSESNEKVVDLVNKIDRRQEIKYAVEKDREDRRAAGGEQ